MIGMNRTSITPSLPTMRVTDRCQVMSTKSGERTIEADDPNHRQYKVDFTSILRIRPLSKGKEKEDFIVLEKAQSQRNSVDVAVLHPNMMLLTSPEAKARGATMSATPNFIQDGEEMNFHFHKIFDTTDSQESVFFTTGLSMATDAMEPLKKDDAKIKSSVVVGIGNAESGKTHTIFGKISKSSGTDQEGLVPRVLDALFSQSRHHLSSKLTFGVRLIFLLVEHNGAIRDLLVDIPQATSHRNGVRALVASFEKTDGRDEKELGGVNVSHDPVSNDFHVSGATSQICLSSAQARDLLILGLQRSQNSRLASFGKASSRGHVMITLQPILLTRSRTVERCGGTICLVDLSGNESGKKVSRSSQMKDCISADSTFGALMHCFRTLMHNKHVAEGRGDALDILFDDEASLDGSEISCVSEPKASDRRPRVKVVPWRQSKVTMILQPLFNGRVLLLDERQTQHPRLSPERVTTNVFLVLHAYPGHRDYTEKRSILNHLEILQGYELSRKILQKVHTGLDLVSRKPAFIQENSFENMNNRILNHTSDDDEFNSCVEVSTPLKQASELQVQPSAPTADDIAEGSGNFIPMQPPALSYRPSHNTQQFVSRAMNDFPGVALTESSCHQENIISGTSKKEINSRDYMRANLPQNGSSCLTTKQKARALRMPLSQVVPGNMASDPVGLVNARKIANPVTLRTKPIQCKLPEIDLSSKALHPASECSIAQNSKDVRSVQIDENQSTLEQRLQDLRKENERLVYRNFELEARCELLELEISRWKMQQSEAQNQSRQRAWTQQDEEAWRNSRKLRLAQQDLIQEPLQRHLHLVEETYQINHKWLDSGKEHFRLGYPKWWKGARELNERDRALVATTLQDNLNTQAHHPETTRKQSTESVEKLRQRLSKSDHHRMIKNDCK